MLIKTENELGTINFDKHVIEKIVRHTTKDFKGVICLTNAKGQSKNMRSFLYEDSYLVEVKKSGANIHIKLNIILKFGVSIKKITNQLIKQIRDDVFLMTDIKPKTISICITGMKSKKTAKRNILIKG